ncbi:MAG: HXXEE domain-containing protein [Actinobacteria bacterium]|nr:HXXEE domain-containing protein [Actinomycetota bacterium]
MEKEDRDGKIFWYLAAASCAHVVEEYLWPGGFLESAKEIAPAAFEHASLPIIVGVNSSMVIGCTLGALMRRRSQVLGLSMSSLLFQNAVIHSLGSLRMKGYMPGLVTGLVLYVPLSVSAFRAYKRSPQYKRSTAAGAAVLGTVLHSTPFVSFAIRGALAKRSHNA